jgi:hypothetical protein
MSILSVNNYYYIFSYTNSYFFNLFLFDTITNTNIDFKLLNIFWNNSIYNLNIVKILIYKNSFSKI